MKILIAAGGSGGHIFPAVALARTLKETRPDAEILFVGSSKALDRRIFDREHFSYRLLSANKMPYGPGLGLVIFFAKLAVDFLKSLSIVVSSRPSVVVGFGGYISFPIVLAAAALGVATIVHEQNVVPGRANRLIFRLADRIAITFEETKSRLSAEELKKTVRTGNPIRKEMLTGDKPSAMKKLGLTELRFTVLVIGGSQGAHGLNETFVKALEGLGIEVRKKIQVLHITGAADYEWAAKAYADIGIEHRVWSFVDRIEEAYSASDLVVTRSGASAIFELALFAKPMVLVPYPFAMSHQAENAAVFAARGAAIEMDEAVLTPGLFREKLLELFNDRPGLKALADAAGLLSVPEASERFAKEVLNLAK